MIKIMYLTTDQEELHIAMEYAKKKGLSLYPKTVPAPEEDYIRMCIDIAKDRDVDVIVAKGRILSWLQKLKCPILVLPSGSHSEETLFALWEVQQKWKQEQLKNHDAEIPKVALLSHQPLSIDTVLYGSIFGMEVKNAVISSLNFYRAEQDLLRLKSEGYRYVICGNNFRKIAEKVDIDAFYILRPSMPQMIWKDLDRAQIIAEWISAYKKNLTEMKTVIDYAFEAVFTVNSSGKISLCNQAAANVLQCSVEDVIGKTVWEMLPELSHAISEQELKEGKACYGRVVERGVQAFVMNVTPLKRHEEIMGAVVHLTEFREIEKLEAAVKSEYRAKGYTARYTFEDIAGESEAIRESRRLARQFSRYDSNVLIAGETGTGKEVFAQSIHNASLRKEEPFVAVNCGAIPVNLLESELFGYVDGAFTGASRKGKKGLMEIANHGTLFLDEISEMDLNGQVQLLRVLEERVIRRVGDDKEIPIDIRVIAASNKNLLELIEQGKFREDLYYRLNVLTLYIPPLRDRGDDLILLTRNFVEEFSKKLKKNVHLSPDAERQVCHYQWKGNIRQLKNFCERLVIVAEQPELEADFVDRQLSDVYMLKLSRKDPDVYRSFAETEKKQHTEKEKKKSSERLLPLNEKEAIIRALNESSGNRTKASEILGISKTSLWRKMKAYGITEQF